VPTLILHGDDDQIVPIAASPCCPPSSSRTPKLKDHQGRSARHGARPVRMRSTRNCWASSRAEPTLHPAPHPRSRGAAEAIRDLLSRTATDPGSRCRHRIRDDGCRSADRDLSPRQAGRGPTAARWPRRRGAAAARSARSVRARRPAAPPAASNWLLSSAGGMKWFLRRLMRSPISAMSPFRYTSRTPSRSPTITRR
jgi:hypothetical protein